LISQKRKRRNRLTELSEPRSIAALRGERMPGLAAAIANRAAVAAARDQAHTLTVTLQAEAVAVKLDLVEPVGTRGNDGGLDREGNSNIVPATPRKFPRCVP
jgi:hypothetical protein